MSSESALRAEMEDICSTGTLALSGDHRAAAASPPPASHPALPGRTPDRTGRSIETKINFECFDILLEEEKRLIIPVVSRYYADVTTPAASTPDNYLQHEHDLL